MELFFPMPDSRLPVQKFGSVDLGIYMCVYLPDAISILEPGARLDFARTWMRGGGRFWGMMGL